MSREGVKTGRDIMFCKLLQLLLSKPKSQIPILHEDPTWKKQVKGLAFTELANAETEK